MDEEIAKKQAFESDIFKIPKEKYEKDLETELAKGKKNEILDIFANSNFLRSEVHESCKKR